MKIKMIAASAAALLGSTLFASPAHAADREVVKSWATLQCSGDNVREKCNIRVPGGYNTMVVNYYHGGAAQATEVSYGSNPYVAYSTPQSINLGGAVAIDCSKVGSQVTCNVFMRSTVDMLNMDYYANGGVFMGGIKFSRMLG